MIISYKTPIRLSHMSHVAVNKRCGLMMYMFSDVSSYSSVGLCHKIGKKSIIYLGKVIQWNPQYKVSNTLFRGDPVSCAKEM